jgi:uncharacterized protein (DUF433 family)
MATVLHIDMIISDPEIRNGKPVIAGTTLRVSDVVAWHVFGGQTAEEIALNFSLNLAQVYAALSYYHLHKAEIDNEIRENSDKAEQLVGKLRKQGKVITLE